MSRHHTLFIHLQFHCHRHGLGIRGFKGHHWLEGRYLSSHLPGLFPWAWGMPPATQWPPWRCLPAAAWLPGVGGRSGVFGVGLAASHLYYWKKLIQTCRTRVKRGKGRKGNYCYISLSRYFRLLLNSENSTYEMDRAEHFTAVLPVSGRSLWTA